MKGRQKFWTDWASKESYQRIGEMLAQKERQAEHDGLTDLYNRYGLENRIKEKCLELKRQKHPGTFVFIDMDKLKEVNDRKGHKTGDKFIKSVAYAIETSTRPEDIKGRWGGDEFVIFLPRTNLDQAYTVTERIRNNLPKGFFVSAGISEWKIRENPFIVLEKGENDMYREKHGKLTQGERSKGIGVIILK